jgi:hypothetical protein
MRMVVDLGSWNVVAVVECGMWNVVCGVFEVVFPFGCF